MGGFEVYGAGRFFTVTGHLRLGVSPRIEQRDAELAECMARLLPAGDTAEPLELTAAEQAVVARARAVPDDELLAKAQGAANGAQFGALWDGDRAGQVAVALGDANDRYGGIGRNGAQKTPEAQAGTLKESGAPYDFAGAPLYNSTPTR